MSESQLGSANVFASITIYLQAKFDPQLQDYALSPEKVYSGRRRELSRCRQYKDKWSTYLQMTKIFKMQPRREKDNI